MALATGRAESGAAPASGIDGGCVRLPEHAFGMRNTSFKVAVGVDPSRDVADHFESLEVRNLRMTTADKVFRFYDFEFSTRRQELRKGGHRVRMSASQIRLANDPAMPEKYVPSFGSSR